MKRLIVAALLLLSFSISILAQDEDSSQTEAILERLKDKERKHLSRSSHQNKYYKLLVKEQYKQLRNDVREGQFIFDDTLSTFIMRIIDPVISEDSDYFLILLSKSIIPNATSYGDGIIIINLGLLGFYDSIDELSFVLCHEIAHDQLEHTRQKLQHLAKTRKSDTYKKMMLQKKKKNLEQLNSYRKIIYQLHANSRIFEDEADSLGLILYSKLDNNASAPAKALAQLDSTHIKYSDAVYIDSFFINQNITWKDYWLDKPSGLLASYNSTDEIYGFDTDSVQSHPEPLERSKALAPADNSIISSFKDLPPLVRDQITLRLIQCYEYDKRLDFLLYDYLRLFRKDVKDKSQIVKKILHILDKTYTLKENHQLGKYIPHYSSREVLDQLNILRLFLHNIELKDISKMKLELQSHYNLEP